MIYTQLTNNALKLCFEVHKDQLDKANMPYVFHQQTIVVSKMRQCFLME